MYETIKKILYFVATVYFIISLAFATILYSRLEQTRHELESVRMELSAATDREQQLTDTIGKCWKFTERTNQILSESADTIQGVRRQLQEVRKNYEAMENIIANSSLSSSNGSGYYNLDEELNHERNSD